MPTYQILNEAAACLNGQEGLLIEARLTPDTELSIPYETEMFNPVTEQFEVTTLLKTDFSETSKYFVPEGEDKAAVLSQAAWNHEDGLAAIKASQEIIPQPNLNPIVEALPRE